MKLNLALVTFTIAVLAVWVWFVVMPIIEARAIINETLEETTSETSSDSLMNVMERLKDNYGYTTGVAIPGKQFKVSDEMPDLVLLMTENNAVLVGSTTEDMRMNIPTPEEVKEFGFENSAMSFLLLVEYLHTQNKI